VRSFAWVDAARKETATPNAADHREVTVQIWYPASVEESEVTALYSPELEAMLAASTGLPADDQRFVRMHTPLLNIATNSLPGATIAESTQPWRVILFSPGGNVSRQWQTALAERIASSGLVFVSMSHPYSTIDIAPQSGFSMSIDWGLDQEDADAATAVDDRLGDILAGDAAFVLKQLRELAENEGLFGGTLDLKHVGIAGHSRGGTTVGRACSSNPDFIACAVIDNIGPDRERETGVQPPWLTLRSPWGPERTAALHDFLGRTGSVAYDLELGDSNHFTCTDMPLFFPDLRLAGVEPAGGIEACANVLLSFFDAHLKSRISIDEAWNPPSGSYEVTIERFRRSSP
jgi:pimeloyl-ACP methyl ester carboxylesterase